MCVRKHAAVLINNIWTVVIMRKLMSQPFNTSINQANTGEAYSCGISALFVMVDCLLFFGGLKTKWGGGGGGGGAFFAHLAGLWENKTLL